MLIFIYIIYIYIYMFYVHTYYMVAIFLGFKTRGSSRGVFLCMISSGDGSFPPRIGYTEWRGEVQLYVFFFWPKVFLKTTLKRPLQTFVQKTYPPEVSHSFWKVTIPKGKDRLPTIIFQGGVTSTRFKPTDVLASIFGKNVGAQHLKKIQCGDGMRKDSWKGARWGCSDSPGYFFPHNHGSGKWLCLKGNYY